LKARIQLANLRQAMPYPWALRDLPVSSAVAVRTKAFRDELSLACLIAKSEQGPIQGVRSFVMSGRNFAEDGTIEKSRRVACFPAKLSISNAGPSGSGHNPQNRLLNSLFLRPPISTCR